MNRDYMKTFKTKNVSDLYRWALEELGDDYAASALWMFLPLPSYRVFGMACAEQYKLGLKNDSRRPGLVGHS